MDNADAEWLMLPKHWRRLGEAQHPQNSDHSCRQPAGSRGARPKRPRLSAAAAGGVAAVVQRQRDVGLDVINGRYPKGDWLTYIDERLGGFTQGPPGRQAGAAAGQGPRNSPISILCQRARHAVLHPATRSGIRVRIGSAKSRSSIADRRCSRASRFFVRSPKMPSSPAQRRRARAYRDNEFYEEGVRLRHRRAMRTGQDIAKADSCRSTMPGCRRCGIASAWPWGSRPSASAA